VLIGACFSLSLGIFFGSFFNTASGTGAISGIRSIIFILGGIFVGPLEQILGNGPILLIARLLPTYYLAERVVNATQNLGIWSTHLIDISIIMGCTVALLTISACALRRQSAVLAVI